MAADVREVLRHSAILLVGLGAIVLALLVSGARASAVAPEFVLTDQQAVSTRLSDFRGRAVLLTFLYTHCPDTCPLYLANIRTALRSLDSGEAPAPKVVIVTVDPDRDDIARLREYSRSWPPEWAFLTGSHAEVSSVWKAYDVTVSKRPLSDSSDVHAAHGYTVIHPAKLLLVDPDGTVRRQLSGEWNADQLAETLSTDLEGPPLVAPLAGAIDLARQCGEFAARQPGLAAALVILTALAIGAAPTVLHRLIT